MPRADPAELLKIAAANPYPEKILLSGRAAIKGKDGWVKSKVVVLVRRPDSMRVTLLDPAGMAWFVGTANNREVAYAAPAKKLYKKMEATQSAMLRIGQLKLHPYDLIRFIHPGLERLWLEDATATHKKNILLVKKPDASFKMEFTENMRLKNLTATRANGGPVRYIYSYTKDGGYSVEIDRKIRFEFDRVQTGREMSDDLFDLPAFP